MTNVTPIRPPADMTPLEQLRAFVEWERTHNPDKRHIAAWALDEIERRQAELNKHPVTIKVKDAIHGTWNVTKVFPGDVIAETYEVPQWPAAVRDEALEVLRNVDTQFRATGQPSARIERLINLIAGLPVSDQDRLSG